MLSGEYSNHIRRDWTWLPNVMELIELRVQNINAANAAAWRWMPEASVEERVTDTRKRIAVENENAALPYARASWRIPGNLTNAGKEDALRMAIREVDGTIITTAEGEEKRALFEKRMALLIKLYTVTRKHVKEEFELKLAWQRYYEAHAMVRI